MIPIELLIIPLRALLAALGTGELPAGAPGPQLRATATVLDDARNRQSRINRDVDSAWSGVGAARATSVMDRAAVDAADFSDNSAAIADVIDSASEKIRRAAGELQAIVDSFVAVAAAMGPALYTPAGLAAILPVAMTHLQRGIDVVERTRTELRTDTDRLLEIGRTTAPAESGSVDAQLARVGTELGNLGNAAFGPVESAAGSPAPDAGGDPASTVPAGLSATDPGGTGVAITLPDGSVAYAPNERAAKAVRAALSQQGVPYVWGGTSPGQGLDCSGLTQWAYREAGVELPRLAQEQDTAGVQVARADLQPGDLAVWSGHVAMYVGNGQMVEAGDPVQVNPVRTSNLDQTFEGFYRPN